eukprot:15672135-Heterocapsa_arctica.AAC.1
MVAVIPDTLQVAGFTIGNIVGPFNTVNRGELLAIATLVEAFGGKGEALTDSSFVSKGIYKMLRGLLGSSMHQDLWDRIQADLPEDLVITK